MSLTKKILPLDGLNLKKNSNVLTKKDIINEFDKKNTPSRRTRLLKKNSNVMVHNTSKL